MKLSGISWQGYSLPFRRRYVTSGSRAESRHGLLVFLGSDDGLTGIGDASPVGPGSIEEVKRISGILQALAPRLLENGAEAIDTMLSSGNIPPSLNFGLETALLDIRGQAGGVPVSALLGGQPSRLPVNAIIASELPDEAATEAGQAIAAGFTSLKLKVGRGELEQDEALVAAVRDAAGAGVKLRLDPNQSWTVDQAITAIRRLARYDLEYVEQPVAADDVAGLARVRASVSVPVAADESLASPEALQNLLDAGAADIFILKAARLGGLKTTLEIAYAALKAGRRVVVTTSLESGAGIAASAHLAAAISSGGLAQGLATGSLFIDDLVSPPLIIDKGILSTPDSPGLGVKVNEELLRKYGLDIIGSAGSLPR